jgi:hypothetical protein
MYDVAFPAETHISLAKKFNKSVHPRWLISFHRKEDILSYGYDVEFIASRAVHMTGNIYLKMY